MSNGKLTARENEVIELMRACKTDDEISSKLGISYHTARTHVSNIRKKFRVNSRMAAVMAWLARNDNGGASDAPDK